ncbi:MAG: membrane protein insertase YidC [Actinomycetota bacterium]|nr:membrane protein insertase YidC [Actinomycetota bacterium]
MSTILGPIETAVSWIMVMFHSLFSPVFGASSGWAWGLSIVGLVVVIRILLIPLFVKQINAMRGMQLLQPEIKKLQEKYKNDRERQSQELMKLYRETGTNPLSSCLPVLAQAPIFFALFRVLNGLGGDRPKGLGVLQGREDLVQSAHEASIFGAKISETFLRADTAAAKVVALVLILLMSASTFVTQRQLMTKNMPAASMDNPFMRQQKVMLYLFPVIFAVTGVNFPIGVLLYWLTTNVWSMGQQFYVIHHMPAPGSIAAENLERRKAEKARRRGVPAAQAIATEPTGSGGASAPSDPASGQPVSGQRQQPRRKSRDKRRSAVPKPPAAAGDDGPAPAPSS